MPHRDPEATEKARVRETPRLTEPSGAALQGSLSYTETPGASAVVYVHGFGSTRGGKKGEALESACARRGWTFAAFDFRAHGQSDGALLDLRGESLLEDLDHVRTYLAGRGVRRLYPVGSSMGGWATAWFALRRPEAFGAVVFLAPAFHFLHSRWAVLSEAEREAWRRTGRLRLRNEWLDVEIGYGLAEERDQFPPSDLAARWSLPALLYHGMRDATLPYADSLAFIEQSACSDVELRLIKDGDHRLLPSKDEIAEAACDFFARRGFQT